MTFARRDRFLILGAVCSLILAVLSALVMTEPYGLSGFLVVALLCAAISGAADTLVDGRRTLRRILGRKSGATAVLMGIVAGVLALLLLSLVMALTISGFTLRDPVQLSVLMSPRIFLVSFFVALSAFVYTSVGGLLFGPLFGPLVERVVSKEKELVR